MAIKRKITYWINGFLARFGARIAHASTKEKPWDHAFVQWIEEAKASGKDPNDIGDVVWADDPLKEAMEKHYLPHVRPDGVVLELGPGSGRLSRHLISRCKQLVLVDYSQKVCDWLRQYLQGKGNFAVHRIDTPALPMIGDRSIDVILANGVFEHIEVDDLYWYLVDFHRVLKRGGVVSFNFDNIMAEEGIAWFKKWLKRPGDRCVFRWYHPDSVCRLAESVGFKVLSLATSQSRFAYVEMRKT